MTIAFISLMEGYRWGGSEELWFGAAKLALIKNHSVFTVTKKWDSLPDKIAELAKLKAVNNFYRTRPMNIFDLLAVKSKFRKSLHTHVPHVNADFYVISCGSTFDLIYKMEFCENIIKSGKPFITISQHNYENGHLLDDYYREWFIRFTSKAKKMLFVSHRNLATASRQMANTPGNAAVIGNPVNLINTALNNYPHNDKLLMACVARLDCDFKGQDLLLHALSDDKWKPRNFELTLYGEGPHRAHLQKLIELYSLSRKVKIVGFVKEIADKIWSENQILLLPSLSEGIPLTLVEAMLCGRAALATDTGDIERYIINGVTGFLAATASINSLSASLEELWLNRSQLENLGLAAYNHALQITDLNPSETLLKIIET